MAANVVTDLMWRRLDVPGHEACRLSEHPWGWQLEGTAIFLEGGRDRVHALRHSLRRGFSFATR